MLSLIKKLFQQQEPKKEIRMSLKETEDWLHAQESLEEEKLAARLAAFRERFQERAESMQHHLGELQKATLQNTNIPPKAFHFMEGNRESYLRFMKQFLGAASQFPTGANGIESYCREFSSHLDHFASASQRNYFVLQNFFANTLKDIGQLLKALEGEVKELQEDFKGSRLKSIIGAKKDLAGLNELILFKKKLEGEVADARKTLELSARQLSDAEEHLSSFEKGEEWKHLKTLEQRLVAVKEHLREEEQRTGMLFSPLEKSLRKFSKEAFEHHTLIEKYAENPAGALEQDQERSILPILEKLKKALEKSGLGLDEKRVQKASTAIGSLTKEIILQHQQSLKKLREESAKIEGAIASSGVLERYESQKKSIEAAAADVERKKRFLEALAKQLGEIDCARMLQNLENTLNEKLGEQVIIGEVLR